MLSQFIARLFGVMRGVIVGIFVLLVAVTFAQVIFRYLLASPLTWTEEFARYCFVWIVYLTAPIALHRGLHIGVDMLTIHLSEKSRRVLAAVNDLFTLAVVVIIGFASIEVLSANRLQFSPALGIQMAIVYLAIPLSMGVMALVVAAKLLRLTDPGDSKERP